MPVKKTQVLEGKAQVCQVSEEQLGVPLFSQGYEVPTDQGASDRGRIKVGKIGRFVSAHVSSGKPGQHFEHGLFGRSESNVETIIYAGLW